MTASSKAQHDGHAFRPVRYWSDLFFPVLAWTQLELEESALQLFLTMVVTKSKKTEWALRNLLVTKHALLHFCNIHCLFCSSKGRASYIFLQDYCMTFWASELYFSCFGPACGYYQVWIVFTAFGRTAFPSHHCLKRLGEHLQTFKRSWYRSFSNQKWIRYLHRTIVKDYQCFTVTTRAYLLCGNAWVTPALSTHSFWGFRSHCMTL